MDPSQTPDSSFIASEIDRTSLGGKIRDNLLEEAHKSTKTLDSRGVYTDAAGDAEYGIFGNMNPSQLAADRRVIEAHFEGFHKLRKVLGIDQKPVPDAIRNHIRSFEGPDVVLYTLHYLSETIPGVPNMEDVLDFAFGRTGVTFIPWEDAKNTFEIRASKKKTIEWIGTSRQKNIGLFTVARHKGLKAVFGGEHRHMGEGDQYGAYQDPDHPEFDNEDSTRVKILTVKAFATRDCLPIYWDLPFLEQKAKDAISVGPSRASQIRTLIGRDEHRLLAMRGVTKPTDPSKMIDTALVAFLDQYVPTLFATDPKNADFMATLPKPQIEFYHVLTNQHETRYTEGALRGMALSRTDLRQTNFRNHQGHISYYAKERLDELGYKEEDLLRLAPKEIKEAFEKFPVNRQQYPTLLMLHFFQEVKFERDGNSTKIIWPDDQLVPERLKLPSVTFGQIFGGSREKREAIRIEKLQPVHTLTAYEIGRDITGNTPQEKHDSYWQRAEQSPILTTVIKPSLLKDIIRTARTFGVGRI